MFGTYSQYTRLIMDNYDSKKQVENVLESVWDGILIFTLGKEPNSGL